MFHATVDITTLIRLERKMFFDRHCTKICPKILSLSVFLLQGLPNSKKEVNNVEEAR